MWPASRQCASAARDSPLCCHKRAHYPGAFRDIVFYSELSQQENMTSVSLYRSKNVLVWSSLKAFQLRYQIDLVTLLNTTPACRGIRKIPEILWNVKLWESNIQKYFLWRCSLSKRIMFTTFALKTTDVSLQKETMLDMLCGDVTWTDKGTKGDYSTLRNFEVFTFLSNLT